MQHRRTMLGAVAICGVLYLLPASSARAQQQRSCHFVCAPSFSFRPSLMRTHFFSEPTVRELSTGAVQHVPSQTAFAMQFNVNVPTVIPRTTLFANVTWFPNLSASTNPFTEYNANEVPGTRIRVNTPSLGLGVFVDALTPPETGGWFDLGGYIGDAYSKAAEPKDASDYTHKLDLGVTGTLHPFNKLPQGNYLKNVNLFVALDYRATGLPSEGDIVPAGKREWLTGARPSLLQIAFDFPLAPLFPKK